MINFSNVYQNLIDGNLDIESISEYQKDGLEFAQKITTSNKIDLEETKAFLMICLDYYTYSESGGTLIPDSLYDACMQRYYSEIKSITHEKIIFADELKNTSHWGFIKHKIPGMVGTLDKLYSYDELKAYLSGYSNIHQFVLSAKFDGVSVCIEIENGKIISGATRYNGFEGQDITQLILRADLPPILSGKDLPDGKSVKDGFYKCEMVISTENFEKLITLKKYANRRSATTGIINTPKNLEFARYITVIPLVYYSPKKHLKKYIAPVSMQVASYSPRDLLDQIEKMLEQIRSKDFPFRVDGVVINPVMVEEPNEGDILEHSIAYKVNTNEAKTRIEYGYMSIGRLGGAMPMLKVEPVEVNETIVTDVSLGSYAKFLSMGLLENEEVIVYSAGDVIPQVKLPLMRTNFNNADDLKISKYCPYCNQKLTRVGSEYECQNQECPRIICGKISNFIIKLGVAGFSDKTIELIHTAGHLNTISDLFELTREDLLGIPGFDNVSAEGFMNEVMKLKTRPVMLSEFFGALGIEGISMKKCNKIFKEITLPQLMNKSPKKLREIIRCADGIGTKTADTFLDFVEDNKYMISRLLDILNIVGDTSYKGTIAFTGFRNSSWESKFNEIGYEVTDSVTTDTECLISANDDRRSTKCKTAISKGIPIVGYRDIEDIYNRLRAGKKIKGELFSI